MKNIALKINKDMYKVACNVAFAGEDIRIDGINRTYLDIPYDFYVEDLKDVDLAMDSDIYTYKVLKDGTIHESSEEEMNEGAEGVVKYGHAIMKDYIYAVIENYEELNGIDEDDDKSFKTIKHEQELTKIHSRDFLIEYKKRIAKDIIYVFSDLYKEEEVRKGCLKRYYECSYVISKILAYETYDVPTKEKETFVNKYFKDVELLLGNPIDGQFFNYCKENELYNEIDNSVIYRLLPLVYDNIDKYL